jgi:hypothetical protein
VARKNFDSGVRLTPSTIYNRLFRARWWHFATHAVLPRVVLLANSDRALNSVHNYHFHAHQRFVTHTAVACAVLLVIRKLASKIKSRESNFLVNLVKVGGCAEILGSGVCASIGLMGIFQH